ncbi:MAG: GAF domain-containing protein [Rhodospirillales bacterium]|nr:MAG: GAF domain-containing protein [Rhodospirillales bacterium]
MSDPRAAIVPAPAAARATDVAIELLAEMGQDFAGSRSIGETLRRALHRIVDHLDAAGGALFLLEDDGRTLLCTASVGATNIEGIRVPVDRGIVGRSVRSGRGELVGDVRTDPEFFQAVDERTGFVTRSILSAPMSVRDERLGAIELVNKRGEDPHFTPEDLRILEAMAASAALAIVNARLAAALVEQERVRRELELAAEIQRSLLPTPPRAGFPVVGINVPADVVSGDFYDFFELADGRILFNLGDVAGKGMNAALLMAKTASLFRCLGKTVHRPGALLARIDAEIAETATRGMFVTMVAGILNPATGEICFANAGHEPPLLHRDNGTFQAFPADHPPLGIAEGSADTPLPEATVHLDGGTFYVVSDGVTEGLTVGGAPLGVEGLQDILREAGRLPPAERLTAVTSVLTAGPRPLHDDATVLAVVGGSAVTRPRSGSAAGRREPASEELVRVSVPSCADRLRLLRQVVALSATQSGCCQEAADELVLAVDEACQNIIRHAYHGDPTGQIELSVHHQGRDLIVLLRDYAPPVDVSRIKPRDLGDLRPGGLGTHLIRALTNRAEFLPTPPGGGTLLKLVKRIR